MTDYRDVRRETGRLVQSSSHCVSNGGNNYNRLSLFLSRVIDTGWTNGVSCTTLSGPPATVNCVFKNRENIRLGPVYFHDGSLLAWCLFYQIINVRIRGSRRARHINLSSSNFPRTCFGLAKDNSPAISKCPTIECKIQDTALWYSDQSSTMITQRHRSYIAIQSIPITVRIHRSMAIITHEAYKTVSYDARSTSHHPFNHVREIALFTGEPKKFCRTVKFSRAVFVDLF